MAVRYPHVRGSIGPADGRRPHTNPSARQRRIVAAVMFRPIRTWRRRAQVVLAAAVTAGGCFAAARSDDVGSLRVFDPDRLAALEVDMWQAYYRRERVRLTRDLMTALLAQYHCSYANAVRVGFRFGRAASRFAVATGGYESVLPDLEKGYAVVRRCVAGAFDPAAVAKAELAWWVARRIPAEQSPEHVGGLIAEKNALIFTVPRERVLEASVLRARAGRLRDERGEQADWQTVSDLLHRSYRALHQAVQ
jgi:hypothetical protein